VVVISASSGEVFSGEFPRRSSGAYLAVAGLGFLAFLAEGILALFSPLLAVGLIAVTIAGVFAASNYVARRM